MPTEQERKILAYHEAGHAVAFALQPDLGEIRKVTIMPRGNAGGFMASLSKEELFFSRERFERQLVVAFGGRVAEKQLTGTISSGASNDLRQATELAKQMVFDLGMGGEEYVAWGSDSGPVFLGGEISRRKDFSEETARQLEAQVHAILRRSYATAEQLVGEHWGVVAAVAEALLLRETLDGQLVKAAVEKALAGQGAREITDWIVKEGLAADRAAEEESRRAVAEAERQRRKSLEAERLKPTLEPRPASEG